MRNHLRLALVQISPGRLDKRATFAQKLTNAQTAIK